MSTSHRAWLSFKARVPGVELTFSCSHSKHVTDGAIPPPTKRFSLMIYALSIKNLSIKKLAVQCQIQGHSNFSLMFSSRSFRFGLFYTHGVFWINVSPWCEKGLRGCPFVGWSVPALSSTSCWRLYFLHWVFLKPLSKGNWPCECRTVNSHSFIDL